MEFINLEELKSRSYSFKDFLLFAVCAFLFGTILGFLISPKKTENNYINQKLDDKNDFNEDLAMEMSELR